MVGRDATKTPAGDGGTPRDPEPVTRRWTFARRTGAVPALLERKFGLQDGREVASLPPSTPWQICYQAKPDQATPHTEGDFEGLAVDEWFDNYKAINLTINDVCEHWREANPTVGRDIDEIVKHLFSTMKVNASFILGENPNPRQTARFRDSFIDNLVAELNVSYPLLSTARAKDGIGFETVQTFRCGRDLTPRIKLAFVRKKVDGKTYITRTSMSN